jgi:hypothetical protein
VENWRVSRQRILQPVPARGAQACERDVTSPVLKIQQDLVQALHYVNQRLAFGQACSNRLLTILIRTPRRCRAPRHRPSSRSPSRRKLLHRRDLHQRCCLEHSFRRSRVWRQSSQNRNQPGLNSLGELNFSPQANVFLSFSANEGKEDRSRDRR